MNITTTKEEFLAARQKVQQQFNTLAPLITQCKNAHKVWQRNPEVESTFDFKKYNVFGTNFPEQTTLFCMALAQSHGNLHAKSLHTKMEGHGILFESTGDQKMYLHESLTSMNEEKDPLIPDRDLREAMRIIAFSEKPVFVPREKISIKNVEVGEVVTA